MVDVVCITDHHYRQQTKFREGNIFTRVCHSVYGWGVISLPVSFHVPSRGVWSQEGMVPEVGYGIPYPLLLTSSGGH